MRTLHRTCLVMAIAAAATIGPAAVVPAPADAAPALSTGSPIRCNPEYLATKAAQHEQKAAEYDAAAQREAASSNPSPEKIAHYQNRSVAHQEKADAYKAKAAQCKEAGRAAIIGPPAAGRPTGRARRVVVRVARPDPGPGLSTARAATALRRKREAIRAGSAGTRGGGASVSRLAAFR